MSGGLERSKDLMAQHRRSMVDWVKAELSGANLKQSQVYLGLPSDRYVVGVLFPIGAGLGIDPAGDVIDEMATDVTSAQEDEKETAESVKQVRYVPPSSVGFSFFVASRSWQIQVMASAKRFVGIDGEADGQARNKEGQYVKDSYEIDCLALSDESIVIRHDDIQKNIPFLLEVMIKIKHKAWQVLMYAPRRTLTVQSSQ